MGDPDQMDAAVKALRDTLGNGLLAVYLHGSAVSGGLRPQSDLDLLAIIDGDMTAGQRSSLTTALLHLSGRHPAAPEGPRCLEVIVFRQLDLVRLSCPAHAEFVYGEWIRARFEAGELPAPADDPEYTVLLAQARRHAMLLVGRDVLAQLPQVPPTQVRQAMQAAMPALLGSLQGDERNVLLTLARMWYTASTGEFATKDQAADWATRRLPPDEATMLGYARLAYLGEIIDEWETRRSGAQQLARQLEARITSSLLDSENDRMR